MMKPKKMPKSARKLRTDGNSCTAKSVCTTHQQGKASRQIRHDQVRLIKRLRVKSKESQKLANLIVACNEIVCCDTSTHCLICQKRCNFSATFFSYFCLFSQLKNQKVYGCTVVVFVTETKVLPTQSFLHPKR